MTLVALLLVVIIFGLLFWLVQQLPLTGPWKQAALVILVVIAILYLLSLLTGGLHLPVVRIE